METKELGNGTTGMAEVWASVDGRDDSTKARSIQTVSASGPEAWPGRQRHGHHAGRGLLRGNGRET